MRLLYVGNTESPHFRAWPRHFSRAGHDVHLLHLAPVKAVALEGTTLHRLPPSLWRLRGGWRLSALFLSRLVRRIRADLVHTHQLVPAGYAAALARSRPHVSSAWGSEVLLAQTQRQRSRIGRVARTADLLTADSHHLLGVLERYGAPRSRLLFLPWGVDSAWAARAATMPRERAAERVGFPTDRPIVLFPRGTAPVYRPDVALDALAQATRKLPCLTGIVAYDSTPNAVPLAELELRANDLGIASNVVFHPKWRYDEMPFVYRAARVCVSVSESDSAPTSVIEALALGVPAIVSDLPWAREPVYREVALDIVPATDVRALSEAIVRRIQTDDPARIDANRRLVTQSFDRTSLLEGLLAEYERLVGARS